MLNYLTEEISGNFVSYSFVRSGLVIDVIGLLEQFLLMELVDNRDYTEMHSPLHIILLP